MEIFSPAAKLMVSHRLAPPGAGAMVRSVEHAPALEAVVLAQFSTARPCDRKANKPPGAAALAERARLMGAQGTEPSVDLAGMAEVIRLAFPGSTVGAATRRCRVIAKRRLLAIEYQKQALDGDLDPIGPGDRLRHGDRVALGRLPVAPPLG